MNAYRLRNRAVWVIPFWLFLISLSANLEAALLFENGPLVAINATNIGIWFSADDFFLSSDSTVTGVEFWAFDQGGAPDGTVDYAILSDAGGGLPVSSPPTASLFSGNVTVTKSPETSPPLAGLFKYEFDLVTPAILDEGTKYWLALSLGGTFSAANSPVWASSQGIIGEVPVGNHSGSLTGWISNTTIQAANEGLAFRLNGSVVPEPTTFAIWSVLGLIGAGVGARRKRRKG